MKISSENENFMRGGMVTRRKTTQNKKKKFPGTKFLGTFGPPPTEKTEKIGKIKGTLEKQVPGNLRSQEFVFFFSWAVFLPPKFRTSSTTTRDRNLQFRGAVSTGGSPLDFLLFLQYSYVEFSKTSPLKSGESSEKSSGENRVKSCHVCGCHGFFGPPRGPFRTKNSTESTFSTGSKFATVEAKRYGECSEVLVFLGKRGRKTVQRGKKYGGSKILRILAPYYF